MIKIISLFILPIMPGSKNTPTMLSFDTNFMVLIDIHCPNSDGYVTQHNTGKGSVTSDALHVCTDQLDLPH